MIGRGKQCVFGDGGQRRGGRVRDRQHGRAAFAGKARQLQCIEGIARQGDRQQHVLFGDGRQAIRGVFVTAFHAHGCGIGAERHQVGGCQAGHIGTVAEAEDVDLACLDQAADKGFEGVRAVIGPSGGQVAAGDLHLLVQAEGAVRTMRQFVAQLVYRRHHLLQGADQFGFQPGIAAQINGFGQAVDGGRRGGCFHRHFLDGQGRGFQRVAQDKVGHLAQRGLQVRGDFRQFAYHRGGVDGYVLGRSRHG